MALLRSGNDVTDEDTPVFGEDVDNTAVSDTDLPEKVGSDSSEESFAPRARDKTLEGSAMAGFSVAEARPATRRRKLAAVPICIICRPCLHHLCIIVVSTL